MLACLIQNYSQTCIMRHRSSDQPVLSGQLSKSWIFSLSITVIFTSIKWSPLLSGRNYLWVSVIEITTENPIHEFTWSYIS